MASRALTCSCCGVMIPSGLNYIHNGKSLCYKCYQDVQKEILAAEEERQSLFKYLKQLFSLTEIPTNLMVIINREVSKGKKYSEIEYTLYYYYRILENPCGAIEVIHYILKDNYELAQEYKEKVAQTKKVNEIITLSNKKRVIKISHEDLEKNNSRKKKKYNIADL